MEWYTPPEIFDALGLTFDLDPCSPGAGRSFFPTGRRYTGADDRLRSPWSGKCSAIPRTGTKREHG